MFYADTSIVLQVITLFPPLLDFLLAIKNMPTHTGSYRHQMLARRRPTICLFPVIDIVFISARWSYVLLLEDPAFFLKRTPLYSSDKIVATALVHFTGF
jgi:hypothetical protein